MWIYPWPSQRLPLSTSTAERCRPRNISLPCAIHLPLTPGDSLPGPL